MSLVFNSMARTNHVLLTAFVAIWTACFAWAASAENVLIVRTSQDIQKALRSAKEPDQPLLTLQLAPGRYEKLSIRDIKSPVILQPQQAGKRPELAGLHIADSNSITLEGLALSYKALGDGESVFTAPFRVYSSSNITFSDMLIEGDLARGHGSAEDGFPAGKGLLVRDSQYVTIKNCEIRTLFLGLSVHRSKNVVISGNEIHGLRKDGLTLAQVQNLLVEGNYFHSFNRAPDAGDHADMIQLWTNKTDAPTDGVTVRNNVFNSGHGLWTQTIFIRNDLVDKGRAGKELFFRNIRIENNVIINAHIHGIYVGETDGLTIVNNTLIRNSRSEAKRFNEVWASPKIKVAERSRNVVIERNAAFGFPEPAAADWSVKDNVEIQSGRRLAAGYYDRIFKNAISGDPLDLANFQYLKDGPLAGGKIGANRLRAAQ